MQKYLMIAGISYDMNFLEQVEQLHIKTDNNCWEWTGELDEYGYATIYMAGSKLKVANLHFFIKIGEIAKGLCVCHSCDNPKCINTDHLWLGTHAENMQDAVNKGRFPRGENHWKNKLKEKDIIQIFELYNSGKYTYEKIADLFEVGCSHIGDILNNNRWQHLELQKTNFIDNRTLASGNNHYYHTNPEKILRGENHGRTKLTDEQVKEIRKLRIENPKLYQYKYLAKMFDVAESQIGRILRNESRKIT